MAECSPELRARRVARWRRSRRWLFDPRFLQSLGLPYELGLVHQPGRVIHRAVDLPAADAGVPAAVRPQGLGGGADAARARTWSGPFGLLQTFADFFKFVFKEVDHPGGRQQGRVPPGAAGHRRCWPSSAGRWCRSTTAGWSPTSMSASSTCSRSRRSASTASSWAAGRRTRNIRSSAACARPRRW